MARYVTDEVVFDLPDGFQDESLHMLTSSNPSQPLSITVAREPAQLPLAEHVAGQLAAIQKATGQTRVVGQRDLEVGHLPAREAKLITTAAKQPLYVRQAYVAYFGTYLAITVSGPRSHQAACDTTADRLLGSLKFRRR